MEILKTRKFKLSSERGKQTDQITQILSGREGIKEVRFESDKVLLVTYNLESIMLKRIEQILEDQGVDLDTGLGQK